VDAIQPRAVVPAELAAQARIERRRRRRRTAIGLLLASATILPPVAWLGAARGTSPSDGTLIYPNTWSSKGVELLADPARDPTTTRCEGTPRRLSARDVVTEVDGEPVSSTLRQQPPRDGDGIEISWGKPPAVCTATIPLGRYPWLPHLRDHLFIFPLVIVMWAIGIFVFYQRPRDPAAQALFAMGALLPWGGTSWPFGTQVVDLVHGRFWPFIIGDTADALLWGAVLHFVLVFPQPAPWLLGRGWRIAGIYAIPFLIYLANVGLQSAFDGSWPDAGSLDDLSYLMTISRPAALTVPSLMAAVVLWQYRRTEADDERRRVRWVVWTLLASAVIYVGLGQGPDLVGRETIPYDLQTVAFLTVPVALSIAVLQYGIFDLRILLRRSLLYGSLTAFLVVIPATAGFALLVALGDEPSLTDPATLNVVLGTCLVIALGYQTLRVRLGRRISRVMFGHRDDPYELVGQLGGQLQASAPADALLASIAETVAQALRLPYVAVELTDSDGAIDARSYGTPQGEVQAVTLVSHGEEVGRLLLGSRPRTEPFGHSDQKLLELLAQQVGLAAENVLLTTQLQKSLARAINTREEERRRLRRDFHDGLGPTLTGNRMSLEAARQLLATDPERVDEILADLARTQQSVVDDVRRLVEELRPPELDHLGLERTLHERAKAFSVPRSDGAGLHVTVQVSGDVDSLPAGVEMAIYRIVLEALTNVARHAQARHCRVSVSRDDAITIEVVDDGLGVLATREAGGVGLNSMRERATELGGACTVTRGTVSGTVVRVRLPVHVP
jgi:two-component system NarL family sensor kinase